MEHKAVADVLKTHLSRPWNPIGRAPEGTLCAASHVSAQILSAHVGSSLYQALGIELLLQYCGGTRSQKSTSLKVITQTKTTFRELSLKYQHRACIARKIRIFDHPIYDIKVEIKRAFACNLCHSRIGLQLQFLCLRIAYGTSQQPADHRVADNVN